MSVISLQYFKQEAKQMSPWTIIPVFVALLITGCLNDTVVNNYYQDDSENIYPYVSVSLPKWYDDHTAAISITYDGGWGTGGSMPQLGYNQDEVLARGLVMDFEVVTATYEPWPSSQAELRNEMQLGIHFFGHGHTHIPHDELETWEECYASFKTCFDLLESWDLKPKAYSYPNGAGRLLRTQDALAMSGFICGRNYEPKTENKYICADDETEPSNWFFLPAIPMAMNYDSSKYVNSHDELAGIMATALEKTAWIIPCYHAVGFVDGWGYYPFDEFTEDLDYIASNDFWCSNMDVIACYIKERNNLEMKIHSSMTTDDGVSMLISFDDGLDDAIYDVPVTVDLTLHTDFSASSVSIEPPLDYRKQETGTNKTIRINVVPDNTTYRLNIMKHNQP